ncbi:hypothetical protein BD779DRAFT_1541614 [Infundibulicybe gibba]|nr:hypothetical protein BD779DRAFT_1541614 [Infundibulicybe gibba]
MGMGQVLPEICRDQAKVAADEHGPRSSHAWNHSQDIDAFIYGQRHTRIEPCEMQPSHASKRPRLDNARGPWVGSNINQPATLPVRNVELFRINRHKALPGLPSRWRNWRRLAVFMAFLLLLLTGAIVGTVAGILAKNRSEPATSDQRPEHTAGGATTRDNGFTPVTSPDPASTATAPTTFKIPTTSTIPITSTVLTTSTVLITSTVPTTSTVLRTPRPRPPPSQGLASTNSLNTTPIAVPLPTNNMTRSQTTTTPTKSTLSNTPSSSRFNSKF